MSSKPENKITRRQALQVLGGAVIGGAVGMGAGYLAGKALLPK